MKNNIKKALVKFQEGLLYFQHFMQIFFCSKSGIIITFSLDFFEFLCLIPGAIVPGYTSVFQ